MLDEPTFGQDRRGYQALLAILRDRIAAGTALLSVTHDLRFAAEMADRVLHMDSGAPVSGIEDARRGATGAEPCAGRGLVVGPSRGRPADGAAGAVPAADGRRGAGMIVGRERSDGFGESLLARASPLVTLLVAIAWLIALATTPTRARRSSSR